MKTFKIILLLASVTFSVVATAQDTAKQTTLKSHKTAKQVYRCPMHPDMVMNKPGQCPKCGAQMGLSGKEQMKMEVMGKYTCPTHPDIVSDKPGKCSKCKSDMVASTKEKMNQKVLNKYSCSMHPEVVSDKPGKCSKCGMYLTAVKEKHQH